MDTAGPSSDKEGVESMCTVSEDVQETVRTENGSIAGIEGVVNGSLLPYRCGFDGPVSDENEWASISQGVFKKKS